MSSFLGQVVRILNLLPIRPKRPTLRRKKLRQKRLLLRAEAVVRSTPVKPNPKFTKRDVDRIQNQGPRFDDLTQHHSITKKGALGKTIKEKLEFIRPQSLGKSPYEAEPHWSKLTEIPFMKFYKGIEERNWKSDLFNPEATPWSILFFEDSGRLFRPSFPGYRALIIEENCPPVWCDLPEPGLETYEEDYLVPRELDDMTTVYRVAQFHSPRDYGYLSLFHRIGVAFQKPLPESKVQLTKLKKKGYLTVSTNSDEIIRSPSVPLMNVSFHLTPSEPCLHSVWYVLPRLAFITFALSFLGICLFIGIFKPKKQMPADPMQAMEFAQSKGRARKDGRTEVRFSDIAGLESIIEDLKDVVEFLKEPKKYRGLHAKPPKGILVEGPPGTGKTLIAKAIAGEANVPFYQMSGSEFVEAIVGVGAARVRDLFKRARSQGEACIIFVDEIDALGAKRSEAGVSTNEEREQTLNQLLTEMDGFSSEMGVVFIGATNRADLLDPALQRPGRFDRKVRIMKPTTEGRHQILLTHARKHKLSPEVDLLQLARDLPGLAGAQLSSVLNEAALEVIRRDGEAIHSTDIYNAVDRVIQGLRHPVQPAELQNGRVFAVHEMGRAIVANVLRHRTNRLEAVEKLSIVSRGKDETRTVFYRGKDEDYTMTTRARMFERVCVILAGRAAEEHYYGDATTYGSKDFGPAFRLTQKMVAHYGLSDLGLTSYAPLVQNSAELRHSFEVNVDNIDEDLFGQGLKGAMFQSSDTSTHKMLIKCYEIMNKAYQESLGIISSYSNALEAGSKLLLEKRELTGAEVENIVISYPPMPVQRVVSNWGKIEEVIPRVPSPLSIRSKLANKNSTSESDTTPNPRVVAST
eukprot:g4138.t1